MLDLNKLEQQLDDALKDTPQEWWDDFVRKSVHSRNIDKIIEQADNRPSYIRYGQAVFNEAYILYPNETDQLRGTEFDCFYRDDKVNIFLEKLEKIIEKHECI